MSQRIPLVVVGVLQLFILALVTPTAQAANPATTTVTVTIQNLSVSAYGPVAIGTPAGGSGSVSPDYSHTVNDGCVTGTYSLDLADPAG